MRRPLATSCLHWALSEYGSECRLVETGTIKEPVLATTPKPGSDRAEDARATVAEVARQPAPAAEPAPALTATAANPLLGDPT